MLDAPATYLGVARMIESGAPAAQFRHDAARPMSGYCLLQGDGLDLRVTLFLDNARPLAGHPLRYCAWLLGKDAPVRLGELSGTASGDVTTLVYMPGSRDTSDATAIRVSTYAPEGEPAMGMRLLEGSIVWLEGHESALWASEPESESNPEEADAAEPVQVEDETLHGFKLYPEPATPVTAEPATQAMAQPAEARLVFRPVHALAARSTATGVIAPDGSNVHLYARGLPSPGTFGTDPATGKPCNTYRAWLTHPHHQVQIPLGYLHKAWGDRYQLQASRIPLGRHGSIVISAEDQARPVQAPGTQVLVGSHGPSGPV